MWLMILAASLSVAADDKKAVNPDNTKVNTRDRNEAEATADRQKMNPADRELTRKIRSAVMDDKSLSTYAHNVKIISQDGVVTLKGPVRSDEERKTIEAKAAEIAGSGSVRNQMTVAAPKDGKHTTTSK
jgi:hyperosmotically inducible protein